MTVVPFSLQASVGCPAHASLALALALAAEFRVVDSDRAGQELDVLATELIGVLGDGADTMLADTASEQGRVVDLERGAVRDVRGAELDRLRRRCSHQVAFAVLRELIDRATELRLALPVDEQTRRRVHDERDALRARLN